MSHFVVVVVGPDYDAQLSPYQENNMGNCPSEYMEFYDQEDELLKEYETGARNMVVMEDGSYVSPFDKRWTVKGEHILDHRTVIPPELEQREVPFKELYSSFEQFLEDWHGIKERDPKTNRYGYWENPQAKWDWYSLGGRWTGYFRLKPGRKGLAGDPGVMTEPAEEGHADLVLKGDVDFEHMRNEVGFKAADEFDKAAPAFQGKEIPSWEEIRNRHQNIDKAREEHNEHPVVKAINTAVPGLFLAGDLRDYFCNGDRAAFIERARNQAGVPYAFIKDGHWVGRGEMGWWGMSKNEKTKEDWCAQYQEMLDNLPDDTQLAAVDCHI